MPSITVSFVARRRSSAQKDACTIFSSSGRILYSVDYGEMEAYRVSQQVTGMDWLRQQFKPVCQSVGFEHQIGGPRSSRH